MPVMTPLAMLGAAPRTTTNRMARSLRPNSRMASGNQEMLGMVCSPVISAPTAIRSGRTLATAMPTTVPITRDTANPTTARRPVVATADQNRSVPSISHSRDRVSAGDARAYCGRHPLQTTSCQVARTSRIARALGQVHAQTERRIGRCAPRGGHGARCRCGAVR